MLTSVARATQPAPVPAASPSSRPRVAFVCHNAYGQMTNDPKRHAGGGERLASIICRWLAAAGFPTRMITWDEGQPDGEVVDGVRMIKLCGPHAGLPVVRFVDPRWTSLNAALRRADADVYLYHRGDLGLGQIANWCRRHRRKLLYFIASEPDCDRRMPQLRVLRERALYRYGMKHVDRIISQTEKQRGMLREGFGRDATTLAMPSDYPPAPDLAHRDEVLAQPPRVLWVGRIGVEKRPEWLLDLAERFPAVGFDLVGDANSANDYASGVKERAAKLSNVKLHGRLPGPAVAPFYRRATLLCCTSIYEGFPNTFLEAWSQGLPLLTTFDPDGLVAARGLGWTASNFEQLVRGLTRALQASDELRRRSAAAHEYFLSRHALDVAMHAYADAIVALHQTQR